MTSPQRKFAPSPAERKLQVATARTLAEALPYMRLFAGQTFVIKFGGSAMCEEELTHTFAHDVMLLKQVGINPIVVHGGGPQIGEMLSRLGIESRFDKGLRVTDKATMEIVEMVLTGSINKNIVSAIESAGGHAIGLSGKDGRLVEARKLKRRRAKSNSSIEKVLDLGFVGEPSRINPHILEPFGHTDVIPVIAPIGIGAKGETYNINADTVAGAVAAAVSARKLILLTDVEGVLNKQGKLVPQLSLREARRLLLDGTLSGGMIPKIETCVHAVGDGTGAAHILDGRVPHVLLLETFTAHGVGTMIRPK
jgi:acetylglutamate kinase